MSENTPWEIEQHGADWFNVTDRLGSSVAEAIPTASAARLIAAAPDMLALLKRLRQWDHLDGAGDGPHWKRELDAAIAKAEGRADAQDDRKP